MSLTNGIIGAVLGFFCGHAGLNPYNLGYNAGLDEAMRLIKKAKRAKV